MMLRRNDKPSLYSRQHKRELNREHLVDLLVWCFAGLVVLLLACVIFGFVYFYVIVG